MSHRSSAHCIFSSCITIELLNMLSVHAVEHLTTVVFALTLCGWVAVYGCHCCVTIVWQCCGAEAL